MRARDLERYHRTKHLKPKTEERKRYEAEWRASNREKMRAYSQKHYNTHKEEYAARALAKWREKHPIPRGRTPPEVKREQQARASRRNQAKRNLFFWTLKGLFRCGMCGEHDSLCLDFHHRDAHSKELNPGNAARYARRERLVAEILLCDPLCSNCHRRLHYQRDHAANPSRSQGAGRSRLFREIKANATCVQCGETDPIVLDFHHRDPSTKKFVVCNDGRTRNLASVLEEIAKCDILCCNCHRKHHYNRNKDAVYDLLTLAEIEDVSRQAREAFDRYTAARAA